jgi:toxin ParE1/3/4
VGAQQATVYDEAIVRGLAMLRQRPNLGRDRSDLVPGLRAHPVGRHTIFYRVSGNALFVHRILHQRMDVTPDQLA